MKTTIIILTTLLAFNFSLIFSQNYKVNMIKVEPQKIEIAVNLGKLNPGKPVRTEFHDGVEHIASPEMMITKLAPTTPKVADFEEETPINTINVKNLAPEAPIESEFEDTDFMIPIDPGHLAPATPVEADFME